MSSPNPAETPPVFLNRRGSIAFITRNTPQRLNAFISDLIAEPISARDALLADKTLRLAIATAGGRAFTAGQVLKEAALDEEFAAEVRWHREDYKAVLLSDFIARFGRQHGAKATVPGINGTIGGDIALATAGILPRALISGRSLWRFQARARSSTQATTVTAERLPKSKICRYVSSLDPLVDDIMAGDGARDQIIGRGPE